MKFNKFNHKIIKILFKNFLYNIKNKMYFRSYLIILTLKKVNLLKLSFKTQSIIKIIKITINLMKNSKGFNYKA